MDSGNSMLDGLPQREPDDLLELRTHIPVRLSLKLVALKTLRGVPTRETVAAALDAYFSKLESPAPSRKR
jgi:hypothetical protein